jgi:hypothetical protein
MATNLRVKPPPEDDDGDQKRSRFSIKFGPFEWQASGKFLDRPGAIYGLALIAMSITAVLLLLGDKLWRLFK